MKIRTDFVTNSSSVSFILTMDIHIVDCFLRYYASLEGYEEQLAVAKKLRQLMVEKGTLCYLGSHELYTYEMEFNDDDGSAMTKEQLRENSMDTDVSLMKDEDLLNYIRGEYIYQRRLSDLIQGFGATQVKQY